MEFQITIGGLVASVLSLVVTLLAWRPQASDEKPARLKCWVVGGCLIVGDIFLVGLFYFIGASRVGLPPISFERDNVVARATEASDLEMEAFRQPEGFNAQQLSVNFLPPAQGGEVVGHIEERLKFLRERHWQYGEGTRLLVRSFPEIAADGSTAFVKGIESWRLVLWDMRQKRIISRKDHTNVPQVYQLVKVGQRWFVKWSNTRYKETLGE